MSSLTAFVLAAFVGYGASWYLGYIEGNFALLLFMATVVSGLYWLAERLYFLPQRRRAAQAFEEAQTQRRAELQRLGVRADEVDVAQTQAKLLMQPWWLDWTAGLFPVIAIVFILRSFLFEPFKIPSGSMIPTLLINDLILVNKFHYGVRLPVVNTKIIDNNSPRHGDVMVFRYPPKPSLDYIKRVVGLPGDEVAYLNKQISVNGKPLVQKPLPEFFDADALRYSRQFEERTADGSHSYRIIVEADRPAFVPAADDFKFRENCRYSAEGVVCKVPPGHYFMIGDNRDNSLDSRFWGFVPEENIVGKAFFVWMNFGNLKRIGSFD
ncbi:MAG: signal peptidase I [Betaproteobacteria bacterium]|nr:signal peptidase I [Betaproteobacteria bacterium]